MAEKHYAFIPKYTVNSKELNALPATTRWIYVVMCAECRGRREGFTFTYEQIKDVTGFSQATIRKAIKGLDAADFLDYEHGGLEKNPNKYMLNWDWLEI